MERIWIVHPTVWLKLRITASLHDFGNKVKYADSLKELYDKGEDEFLSLEDTIFPEYVYQFEGKAR